VSVAAAWATYALVERPLRHRVRRVSWRPVPALTALLVATGAGGVAVAASGGVPGRVPFPVQRLATFTYDYATAYREGTCFLKPDQGPSAFTAACVESSGRPLVLLWGDSHAAHLYPGLRSLERSHRFRLAEYTASSCPPFVSYASSDRPECAGVNTAVLARIRQLHPARVVLSAAWEQYPSVEPLVGTVAALRAAGVRSIVVVGPVPKWQDGLPQALFASYRRTHVVPRRMSFALMSSPVQANEQLKRLVPRLGVPYVDALALLCDAHGCITRTGDDLADVTVWDGSHFTDSGSRLFARLAAPALVGRLR
jgi:hypothetical protein